MTISKRRPASPEAESVARRIWLDYVKHHTLPPGIPPNPDEVYAKEWRGWCDWLGVDPTITIADALDRSQP